MYENWEKFGDKGHTGANVLSVRLLRCGRDGNRSKLLSDKRFRAIKMATNGASEPSSNAGQTRGVLGASAL
jgi:hypothetical protein